MKKSVKSFSKAIMFLCIAFVFALTLGVVSACEVTKTYDSGLLDSYKAAKTESKTTESGTTQSTASQSADSQSASDSTSQSGGTSTDDPGTPDHPTPTATLNVPDGYKEVKEVLNVNEFKDNVGNLKSDLVKGVWTIPAGSDIRSRSKSWTKTTYSKYWYVNALPSLDGKTSFTTDDFTYSIKSGSNTSGLKLNSPGDGYACIYIQNGSSSATTQKILINNEAYEYPGTDESSPVVQLWFPVEAGKEYFIVRNSGTTDIYYAELHCVAPDAAASGITVQSTPTTKYLAGTDLDMTGLVVAVSYENGTAEPLQSSAYTVDTSAVDMANPGIYTVGITYNDNTAFKTSFEVVVSALDHIELGMNATEKLSTNSKAGNGVYYNYKVKTVYGLNNTLNTDHLTVMAYNGQGELFSFKNDNTAVTYSGYDMATAGKKAVTVTLTLGTQTATATYEIYVVDTAVAKTATAANVYVDEGYKGAAGAQTNINNVAVQDTVNCFKTIGSALEFIKLNASDIGTLPVNVYVAAGTYNEKLEIESPNLNFIGLGATAEATLIEWDSLYGVNDESGFSGVTDSVFTVAVRDTAENVTFSNITISNYWNSKARFAERADSATCDHRALALLVQSDKFVMSGCRLLGYQDTVEFFTGRQYLKNCYVSGCTDFIFGTNGTTYFENCEIHSVEHVKADNGYLTAMKGCNKGDADAIKYGVIFDKCNFTADSGVNKGGTAVGRCWDKYAAVAVINSTMGEHMSTTPYAESGKGFRYIAMNAKPTASTVQFVEYNNTGAGAVDHKIDGMSEYLTAATAAQYSDMSVIFGTTNGKVTYSSAWNPKA